MEDIKEMQEMNLEEMDEVSGGRGGSKSKLAPKKGMIVYQIQHGDTLIRIAQRYGTTARKIAAVNPTIKNMSDITTGYYIYIPV